VRAPVFVQKASSLRTSSPRLTPCHLVRCRLRRDKQCFQVLFLYEDSALWVLKEQKNGARNMSISPHASQLRLGMWSGRQMESGQMLSSAHCSNYAIAWVKVMELSIERTGMINGAVTYVPLHRPSRRSSIALGRSSACSSSIQSTAGKASARHSCKSASDVPSAIKQTSSRFTQVQS
jgi:hypothetical protein